MHDGYIKLWRKCLDSEMLKNKKLWAFWCWCLLKASYQPIKISVGFIEVELEPGQLIFGRKKAAFELDMTEQEIRTSIDSLRKTKNITIKSTNKFSIISIINWNRYQSCENENNQQNNQQVTSKQPASNQQVTTNNKLRNKEDKEDINTPLPPKGDVCEKNLPPEKPKRKKRISELSKEQSESFGKFWSIWPKKVAQMEAEKAWMKIDPQNGLVEEICSAVERFKRTEDWKKNGGKYIPYPATWLNNKRWRDELEMPEPEMDLSMWDDPNAFAN